MLTMQWVPRDYKSYRKLVEFYDCLQNNCFDSIYPMSERVKKVLQKEGDINYQFPAHSYMVSRVPSLAGATALHIAVMKNNVEVFEILINAGADITIQNHYGCTALHSVFLNEKINYKKTFFDIALATQVSIDDPSNPCDSDGISHFHIACTNDNAALVEFFLQNGIPSDSTVKIDAKQYAGYTPLHFAAKGCAVEVIRLLLKYEANMNAKDARGLTPFHVLLEEKIVLMDKHAALEEQVSDTLVLAIDEALIQLIATSDVDELGLTQFHIACAMKDVSVVEHYLAKESIDIEQQVKMNSPFRPGYTALHFAVHCNLKSANMLIHKKANFEVKSANGLTQMDLLWQKCKLKDLHTVLNACWKYTKFSHLEARLMDFVNHLRGSSVDKLVAYLRDLIYPTAHIEDTPRYWVDRTLLHFAVLICRNKYEIEACLRANLDKNIDTPDINGETPVHLASRINKLDVVKILLKGHSNNLVDKDGLSYLHIACALGEFDYVNKLSSPSQNKNAKSVFRGHYAHPLVKPGSTALHVAMAGGHCAIIETLLDRGLSPEITDDEGRTPLHHFLRLKKNIEDICRVLLRSNKVDDSTLKEIGLTQLFIAIYCGELNIKTYATPDAIKATIKCDDPLSFLHDYDGCTPLSLAIKRGAKIEMVEILLECESDLLALNPRGDCPLYAALGESYDSEIVRVVFDTLQSNKELRTRMVNMSGITMLHLACYVCDPVSVGSLLGTYVDIKARVKADCPVWPGDTPLHVLIRAAKRGPADGLFCQTLAAMMKVNVDITAMNKDGDTPIHLALRNLNVVSMYNVITILVQKLQKFTINPSSRHGWSHFHAACLVNNTLAVKSFLENGVDVNQPIGFFNTEFASEAPLHLAVGHKTGIDEYQVERHIVCLLEKGADVKAKDAQGNTALHLAVATGKNLDILQLLIKHGASIECRNIYEQTPLELLLKSENISIKRIQYFKSLGCPLNVSNPLSEQGYVSMLIVRRNGTCSRTMQTLCYEAIESDIGEAMLDNMGRSLLHNIVTTNAPEVEIFSHHHLISKLQLTGIDVDLKDNTGKTALHLAAQFGNAYAVEELLEAGADINILDSSNCTAFTYALYYYCSEKYCPTNTCHAQVVNVLASHVRTLERLELYVSSHNERAVDNAIRSIIPKHPHLVSKDTVYSEIFHVKSTQIYNTELRLGDFLSDTGDGLVSYPFIPAEKREHIDAFFQEYSRGGLRGVCQLQYRKAVKRVELVNVAVNIVNAAAKTIVSLDCIKKILSHLGNNDLENLIEALAGN